MDRVSVLNLIKSLNSFCEHDFSAWNGCIFSKSLSNKSNSFSASSMENQLKMVLTNTTDLESVNIGSYMRKKVHLKSPSIGLSQSPNTCDVFTANEFFDGSPLQLEDHLGDISLNKSIDPLKDSAIMDQSYLVPDNVFTGMMSSLCSAVTSHHFEEEYDWTAIVKSVFPMVVFWEALNTGTDHNGIIFVDYSCGSAGNLTGFSIRKIKVGGQYPYNFWCPGAAYSPKHAASKESQNHMKTIQYVKNMHQNKSLRKTSSIKTGSYAVYELLESNRQPMSNGESSSTFAAISVACEQVREILGTNAQYISQVQIHILPLPGDMDSPALSLYQDVMCLSELFQVLNESEASWEHIRGSQQKEGTSVSDMNDFLSSYNQESTLWRTSEAGEKKDRSTNVEQSVVKQMLEERKELDFTERAWGVLKNVTSVTELVESLDMMFKKIDEGRNTQLWLHSNNHTAIAEVVRESYTGPVTRKSSLNERTALMLVIEIGLDKICRDYRTFFIGNHITVGSCLDAYKIPSSTDFDESQSYQCLKESFANVQKLHHVVEFVVKCKALFPLSDEVIYAKAGKILRDYVSDKLDFNKTFVFDVDFNEIKTMIVDRPPSVWKLIVSSNENTGKRSTCCTWTPDYPFRGILSSPVNMNESQIENHYDGAEDSQHYYLATQTCSHLPLDPFSYFGVNGFKRSKNT